MQKKDVEVKVILLGASGSGKSAVIRRFFNNEFHEEYVSTMVSGENFWTHVSKSDVSNKNVKLHFWDTCGQEKFRSINSQYYKETDIIILVVDGSREKTLQDIEYYIDDCFEKIGPDVYRILVINKVDLFPKFQSMETIEDSSGKSCPFYNKIINLAEKHSIERVYWTSAKSDRIAIQGMVDDISSLVHLEKIQLNTQKYNFNSEINDFARRMSNIRSEELRKERNWCC